MESITPPIADRRRRCRRAGGSVVALLVVGLIAAGCSSDRGASAFQEQLLEASEFSAPIGDGSLPTETIDSEPTASEPLPSKPIASEPPPPTTLATTTLAPTTTIDPYQVEHFFPVDASVQTSWTPEAHASYRATDIFASSGCGTQLFAPVTGVVHEIKQNEWTQEVDDPATRGGNAVSILGDDGVRYYMAHFEAFDPALEVGMRIEAGTPVGIMGTTGRSGACHLHFGLSPLCENGEWWVRRGVVWPDKYLASWKEGGNLSPVDEVAAFAAEFPNACNSVEDTPFAHG